MKATLPVVYQLYAMNKSSLTKKKQHILGFISGIEFATDIPGDSEKQQYSY